MINPVQLCERIAQLQTQAFVTATMAFASVGPAIALEMRRERQLAEFRAERAEIVARFERQREIAESL